MDALRDRLHCSFEEETAICLKNISALPDEIHEAADTVTELLRELEAENSEMTDAIDDSDCFDTSSRIA